MRSAPIDVKGRPGEIPTRPGRPIEPAVRVSFRLPNARAHLPYDEAIGASSPAGAVEVLDASVPPESGLTFEAGRVRGTPAADGEVVIGVRYRFSGQVGGPEGGLRADLVLLVNPDPRALWKDLPSDPRAPFPKPDEDASLVPAGLRRMMGASKRGRSHAHEGKFRDDDFAFAFDEQIGFAVLVVADGAGSARLSREGSRVAVRRARDVCLEHLRGEAGPRLAAAAASWVAPRDGVPNKVPATAYQVLGGAAFEALKAIETAAAGASASQKDLATTLLLAIWHPLADGSHLFTSFWCGDGAIGLLCPGRVHLLGEGDSGDYAGQTRFLDRSIFASGDEVQRRMRFVVVPEFTALVLMTAGVSDPKFETEERLGQLDAWESFLGSDLAPAFADESPHQALLRGLDFWSQGNHDDRTIVVLW